MSCCRKISTNLSAESMVNSPSIRSTIRPVATIKLVGLLRFVETLSDDKSSASCPVIQPRHNCRLTTCPSNLFAIPGFYQRASITKHNYPLWLNELLFLVIFLFCNRFAAQQNKRRGGWVRGDSNKPPCYGWLGYCT